MIIGNVEIVIVTVRVSMRQFKHQFTLDVVAKYLEGIYSVHQFT